MTGEPITDRERRDRLRLIRTDGIGPVTWRELMAHFGSAEDALEGLPDLASRKIKIAATEAAEAELEWLDTLGARAITWGEPAYPASLAQIDDAPPVLAVLGDPSHLSRPAIGIVGARNASANGRRLAETMARDIADSTDIAIVSGLARGIDTAAHSGALDSGGVTVAAMAGGIDIVYPPENTGLYERIAQTGAAVSEMPPGTKPQARHFPRRNRIVSGLSLAVVIVEAAQRSGSLITARMAGEQGRDVLAVPGSPLDPRSDGGNRLIREGATLVRNASDILDAVRPMLDPQRTVIRNGNEHLDTAAEAPSREMHLAPSEHREAVVQCLSPEPVAVDEIVRRCQLTAPVVRTILLELELAGRLERHPGNRVAAI